jgi:hypothetical protein
MAPAQQSAKTEAEDADLPKEETDIMAKSAEYEVGLVVQSGNTEVAEVADGCTGHTQQSVSAHLAEAEGREAKAPQAHLVFCQPTSKTAPLPTPKSEPPPRRFVASFPWWFRLGCAGGASACSWFS